MAKALKDHDTTRTSVLRAIKAAFLNYKTAKNAKPLDEAAEIQILKKMVSQREESISMFKEAKRDDLVLQEESELKILKEFLPAEVTREEIESVLSEWLKENTLDNKSMGLAIRHVKQTLPMADGKLTSDIVKEKLGK